MSRMGIKSSVPVVGVLGLTMVVRLVVCGTVVEAVVDVTVRGGAVVTEGNGKRPRKCLTHQNYSPSSTCAFVLNVEGEPHP